MNIRLILTAIALFAATPLSIAHAAPQMLGLLADGGLRTMHCDGGVCTVEISAICLQEERDIPKWGSEYRAVEPERITLVGTGIDGARVTRPIGAIARIESARDSWAVRISVPVSTLRALGVTDPSLSLEGRVALTPAPARNDPTPLSAIEIGAAVAALSAAPDAVFGGTATDMAAARVMNDMINALPRFKLDPARPYGDLWRRTFGNTPRSGMQQAAKFYNICTRGSKQAGRVLLRKCLELGHDGFISTVNQRYWDLSGPAS